MESIIERVQNAESEAKDILRAAREQAARTEAAAREKAALDMAAARVAAKNKTAVAERMSIQAGENSYTQTLAAATAQSRASCADAEMRIDGALEFLYECAIAR